MCPALFIVHVGTNTFTHVCVQTLPHEGEPTNKCLYACLLERMRISSHVDARMILLHSMQRTLGAFLPSMKLCFPYMCTQTHSVMFVQNRRFACTSDRCCGHVSVCVVVGVLHHTWVPACLYYKIYRACWALLVSVTLAYRHVCHYMCGCTFTAPPPYAGAQRLVTSPRHHDLLNAITYLMCSVLKEDVQTCDDALCMHWPGLQMVSAG